MKLDRTQFENNVSFDLSNLPKFEPIACSTGKSPKLYTPLSFISVQSHWNCILHLSDLKTILREGFPCAYNSRGFCHLCPEHCIKKMHLYGSNSCPHEGWGNIFLCKTAKPLTELSPVVCRRHWPQSHISHKFFLSTHNFIGVSSIQIH
jgi:hypothetical protein